MDLRVRNAILNQVINSKKQEQLQHRTDGIPNSGELVNFY